MNSYPSVHPQTVLLPIEEDALAGCNQSLSWQQEFVKEVCLMPTLVPIDRPDKRNRELEWLTQIQEEWLTLQPFQ
jgi:hypothetical protein